MRLKNIANKFDNTVAKDSYGLATFKCQLAPLELFKIDGVAVKKRSMSTSPDVSIPARGVVSIDGEHYMVGASTPDFWKGAVIRRNYVIQGADGLAELTSIADKLGAVASTKAYASLVFSRYLPEAADSSRYPPQYQLFLAGSESAPANSLVKMGDNWYIVKQSYVSSSGLRIALANMLDAPLFETATLATRTYNPVTDTYASSTASVPIMRVKWQEHYEYLTASTVPYVRGDMQVIMLKSSTPKPPDNLTLSDGVWRVLSVVDEGAQWSIHVRRG
jgi:hypothetical protein